MHYGIGTMLYGIVTVEYLVERGEPDILDIGRELDYFECVDVRTMHTGSSVLSMSPNG